MIRLLRKIQQALWRKSLPRRPSIEPLKREVSAARRQHKPNRKTIRALQEITFKELGGIRR